MVKFFGLKFRDLGSVGVGVGVGVWVFIEGKVVLVVV